MGKTGEKNKKTSVATTILSLYTFVGIKIIVIVAVTAIYSILTLCFVFYVKSLLLHLKTVVGGRFSIIIIIKTLRFQSLRNF